MNKNIRFAANVMRLAMVSGVAVLVLAACGGGGSGGTAQPSAASPPAPPPPPPPAPVNNSPTITGGPILSIEQGSQYSFTPAASDEDGDALSFSIVGLPSWATFDSATGTMEGTPGAADVGVYADTTISVSDGAASSSLAPFSITVLAIVGGSATLTWTAPVTNADGSALSDLAGYVVYWGTAPGIYAENEKIDNPGLTTYVLADLASDTYFIVIAAVDFAGNESAYSNEFTAIVP